MAVLKMAVKVVVLAGNPHEHMPVLTAQCFTHMLLYEVVAH